MSRFESKIQKSSSELKASEISPKSVNEIVEARIKELTEELQKDSDKAGDTEEKIAEQSEKIGETEIRAQSIFGRIHDSFRKLALAMPLLMLLSVSANSPQGRRYFGGEENESAIAQKFGESSGDESEKKIVLQYGSPEYKEAVRKLKDFFAARGVKRYPTHVKHQTEKEFQNAWDQYFKIANDLDKDESLYGLYRAISDALQERARSNYLKYGFNQKREEVESLKQKTRISEAEWEKITKELNYPKILDEAGREFGVEPYRRLGYQKYEEFNADVLQITDAVNSRIKVINDKRGTQYPMLTPGLLSAVVLQEGLAARIDNWGYVSDQPINTYGGIGLDSLISDLPRLLNSGLVDKAFAERIEETDTKYGSYNTIESEIFGKEVFAKPNEAGMISRPADIKIKDAIEAIGAILTERRDRIIDEIGAGEWSKFTSEERDWLTYASYQWGLGNVLSLLHNLSLNLVDYKGEEKVVKTIPISNYVRYENGQPAGRVETVRDYIKKDNSRQIERAKYTRPRLSDFHYQASQVAVSAKIANRFFNSSRFTAGKSGR